MSKSSSLYKVAAQDSILGVMTEKNSTNNQYNQALIAHARQLRNATQALSTLAATQDETVTLAAHQKRVATAAAKLKAQAAIAEDKFNSTVRDGLRDVAARVASKVKLVPNQHEKEIREVFRAMSHADKLQLLNQLVETNSGPELAALTEVGWMLSGLKPELQNTYREQIVYRHARAEFDEQKALLDAMLPAMSIARVAKEAADELSVSDRRIAQIESGEAAANAALQSFTDAVQP